MQFLKTFFIGFLLANTAIVYSHGLPGGFGLGLAPEVKSFQNQLSTFGNLSIQANVAMLAYLEAEIGHSIDNNSFQGKFVIGYFNIHSAYSRNRAEADFRYGYTVEAGGVFSRFSAPTVGIGLFYLAAEKVLFQIKANENFYFYGAKNGFEHSGLFKISYFLRWS